jgi:hypothetical protein
VTRLAGGEKPAFPKKYHGPVFEKETVCAVDLNLPSFLADIYITYQFRLESLDQVHQPNSPLSSVSASHPPRFLGHHEPTGTAVPRSPILPWPRNNQSDSERNNEKRTVITYHEADRYIAFSIPHRHCQSRTTGPIGQKDILH